MATGIAIPVVDRIEVATDPADHRIHANIELLPIASRSAAEYQSASGRFVLRRAVVHGIRWLGVHRRLWRRALVTPQASAAEGMIPQIIHVPELTGDALAPASSSGFRSEMFAAADAMTISVQVGNVPKHLHPNTKGMQYIVAGTGTIWLGEKEVRVLPGDLVIIPKDTPHGGTKPGSSVFKAIAIKTPPQAPNDMTLLP